MSNAINAFLAGRQLRQQENETQQRNALLQERRGMQNTAGKVQNALMSGDREGARSMAMASGNADVMAGFRDTVAGMEDRERSRQQEIFGAVGNLANSLRNVPVEQRSIALRSEAPRLMQLGVPVEEIERYDALLSDPNSSDAVLSALSSRVLDAQEVFNAYAPQMQGENEVMGSYQGGRYTQGPVNPNAEANRAIERTNASARMMTAQTGAAREQRESSPEARNQQRFDSEDDIRSEWADIAEGAADLFRSYDAIATAYNQDNAFGDLALVVNVNKALDPGSVVRESEVEMARSAASVLGEIENWRRRLEDGRTRLPPGVREEIMRWAQQQEQIDARSLQAQRQGYESLITERRLNPERIFINDPQRRVAVERTGENEFASPAPGTVEEGYRFRGGNPADPNNWEPAQ